MFAGGLPRRRRRRLGARRRCGARRTATRRLTGSPPPAASGRWSGRLDARLGRRQPAERSPRRAPVRRRVAAQRLHSAALRRHHPLPVGGAGARLRRALRHPAAAERDLGASSVELGADPVGRLPPDLPQVGARRLRHRLPVRLRRRRHRRPRALPQARPAADRQSRLGAADRRRRADHGHVVRLRLAVQGGGGRRHDLLPDAGQHARRSRGRRADPARPDAHLRRRLPPDARQAAPAGGAALHLQRSQDQLHSCHDRRHRGRILRHADRGHGLPHLHRGRAHESPTWCGRKSR